MLYLLRYLMTSYLVASKSGNISHVTSCTGHEKRCCSFDTSRPNTVMACNDCKATTSFCPMNPEAPAINTFTFFSLGMPTIIKYSNTNPEQKIKNLNVQGSDS